MKDCEMRLRDALRLKAGDAIAWGKSAYTRVVDRDGTRRTGTVLFVTERGGIKVKPRDGVTTWVPYHRVIRKLKATEALCFG